MKIWKIALYAVAIVAFASCGTYTQAPKNTVKVLAVTHEGDTIQLDVNSLRPRVYQNIYHTYPYYHNYWRPSPYYGTWGWGNYYYTRPRPAVTVPNIPNVTLPNNKPTGTYNRPSNVGTGPSLSPSLSTPSNSNTNKGNGSTGNRGIN
jgi:hypothetical protein|tara:strand:+ start:81 stop:524 length:444 start_codon:yes stop_codon:yes gene_type:complete